jgi:hypothetical protein
MCVYVILSSKNVAMPSLKRNYAQTQTQTIKQTAIVTYDSDTA